MEEIELGDLLVNVIGDMEGTVDRRIWEKDHKLFPTIASNQIGGTFDRSQQRLGHLPQTVIPSLVTIGIVVELKEIDITE